MESCLGVEVCLAVVVAGLWIVVLLVGLPCFALVEVWADVVVVCLCVELEGFEVACLVRVEKVVDRREVDVCT